MPRALVDVTAMPASERVWYVSAYMHASFIYFQINKINRGAIC